ncbi:MAG TPA: DUF4159 domain-containing protein [Thermoanaerobaculia bacterium]|nr:DUF4159 domain-containing protein [Thermoanaerobaculia bacterium]
MPWRRSGRSADSRARLRRGALALALLLAASGGVWAAFEQPWRMPEPPQVEYPEFEYDGRFTFARIKFRPTQWYFTDAYMWNLDIKWNHDYPAAEIHFAKIVEEITGVVPTLGGGNILEITDPRLFEHPWAYLCEPGFWNPTEEEARLLREYMLKGGFVVIDDFFDQVGAPKSQWNNFEQSIQRVLPGVILYALTEEDIVFHSFFDVDELEFDDPEMARFRPKIYGIFENNDPKKRLMAVVNYNLDIGDYWEWSDNAFIYPKHLTEKGFKLGINYLMYSILH